MGEEPGPWTVKGVPQEVRAEINRAAKRADQTVGEWICAMVPLALAHERGHLAPVPAGPPDGMPPDAPGLPSLEIVVQLSAVLPRLTQEAGGKRLAGQARRVMAQHLRALEVQSSRGIPRLTRED